MVAIVVAAVVVAVVVTVALLVANAGHATTERAPGLHAGTLSSAPLDCQLRVGPGRPC
jgi:hypothetical protein